MDIFLTIMVSNHRSSWAGTWLCTNKVQSKALVPTRKEVPFLLRYPKFLACFSLRRILTAATRSAPFFCHGQREHRSPHSPFHPMLLGLAKSIGRRRLESTFGGFHTPHPTSRCSATFPSRGRLLFSYFTLHAAGMNSLE